MGKVYEALNRASRGDDVFDLVDDIDLLEEENAEGEEREEQPEQFNFMRYSLGGSALVTRPPATGAHRPTGVRPPAAALVRAKAQPGRELTVSAERIDPHLVSFYNFDPRASQQYNKLSMSLISKAAERGFKRVLVASAQEGEGRTCVTLNLACALARARQRVLVVDCDLVNPSVLRLLGLHCEIGMYEAFERKMHPTAAAAVIRPFGFNVLPTTRPVDNPAELFAAPDFWKMLKTFDAAHDFVLFDSSPLATGGDASLLMRFTDTTLM